MQSALSAVSDPTNNLHLSQPVTHWGTPVGRARAAVIAVHGRARDPSDILGVCGRLNRGDLAYLAPAAAYGSWYPLGFMAPIADNEPWLSHTLERIDALVVELAAAGIERDKIVLLGFSQGGCAVAEYALQHPRRYGGLLVFTGGAVGPDGTRWSSPGQFSGTPALISGATEDPWVPATRMRETASLLRARGALVTEHYYEGREHIVNDDEIRAAIQILKSV